MMLRHARTRTTHPPDTKKRVESDGGRERRRGDGGGGGRGAGGPGEGDW